jgi:hypothetical protein
MRAVVIGLMATVVFGSGCGDSADDCNNTRSCPPPPDAGVTVIYVTPDAGVECNGVCVPAVADTGWSPLPFVFWQGTTTNPVFTNCPERAPNRSQLYYATPDQTALSCPTCACGPSMGSCALPASVNVSASPVCPSDAGDAGVPFDPPSAWDGGCTTNDSIAAVDCDGGPCLATVAPMMPINAACAPTEAVGSKIVTWANTAFACAGGTDNGACEDPGAVCAAAPSTLPTGFSICVSVDGDDSVVMCPAGYPLRSVYYLGGEDDRGCADCECGPPQGDACSSLVSFYADDACSMELGAVTATSSAPACVSVPADSPLGSKRASAPIYTPGTCQPSGGEPIGSIEPKHPVTFCCQQ